MFFFNQATTKFFFPGVDPETVISSKQFLTNEEMEEYFLVDVNNQMKGASSEVSDKPLFHNFNHIVPFIKLTTI